MKQHIRYGNKNEDGTVTWGDWQTSELSQTVGNDTTLIYVDNGEIKASTATVGSAAQPVYLNSGTVTACNSTVGGAIVPIYSNGGTLTACTVSLAGARFGTNGLVVQVLSNGVMEIGKYIDFHATNDDTSDYTGRITINNDGTFTFSGNIILPSGNVLS